MSERLHLPAPELDTLYRNHEWYMVSVALGRGEFAVRAPDEDTALLWAHYYCADTMAWQVDHIHDASLSDAKPLSPHWADTMESTFPIVGYIRLQTETSGFEYSHRLPEGGMHNPPDRLEVPRVDLPDSALPEVREVMVHPTLPEIEWDKIGDLS